MKTKNKKILYSSVLGLILFFSYVFNAHAISIGWDRYIVGGLKTLYSGDKVVIGNTATTTNATLEVVGEIASGYYTATSTTATSTFSGDLRFDAELLPDGLTCANGEILKKTGANDWDCASDSTGSAVGTVSTSSIPTIGNLAYWTSTAYPSLLGTVATSTIGAGTGLSFSGTAGYQVGGTNGTYSVNTSQNIATLSNLTGNGFVKTSGGAGTLSVDTSTYLTTVDISANTNLAVTAPIVLTGDTLSLGNVTLYPAFVYSTSTAWTGTTTIPLGPAYVAETWNGAKCFTDVGTLNVSFSDSTNLMNLLNASTTVGTFTLSTNNTFTASEKRYVDIGTPATSPTKISCTISKSLSAN